jgi:hypothetical protein
MDIVLPREGGRAAARDRAQCVHACGLPFRHAPGEEREANLRCRSIVPQ